MNGTTSTERQAEIDAYGAAVRADLADVPPDELGELLEDLEDHLAEVAADRESPLGSRLGPPESYARELRAAAGLPAAGTADVGGLGIARRLEQVRSSRSYAEVVRFLPELRPAWWVVRAWAAVTVVDLVFVGGSSFPLPTLGLGLVGVLVTAAAIVWSVRLGLRSRAEDRRPGRHAVLLNGALAVLTLIAVVAGAARAPSVASADPVSYDPGPPADGLRHDDGTPITNIYPYSSEGEPLTGVRLYDQDGRPIDDLADWTADGGKVQQVPDAPPQLGNAFPQQRQVVVIDEFGERVVVPMEVPAAASLPTVAGPSAPPSADPGPATPGPSSSEAPTAEPSPGG